MPCPEVQFVDQEDGKTVHKYYMDGHEIPGLSYILDSCGLCRYDKVRKDVMEAARERGDAAHFATRLYDEDNPKVLVDIGQWEESALSEPLDSWTRSRLTGWVKFRKDFQFNPLLIEKPMSWELSGMAWGMTPDRYGESSMGSSVIEVKATAQVMASHAIQTAAQAMPFKVDGKKIGRFVVQLGDGDYKIHEMNDRQDERLFASVLAITHWKWLKGIR